MKKKLTTAAGAPVADNQNTMTAGPRGPALLQDIWFLEKLAHFDREVIPERRMHAKGSAAFGTFTVTHDITAFTRASIFAEIGKETEMFLIWGERLAHGAGYTVRVSELDEPLPAVDPAQAESAAIINRAMERLIRQCPQQYLWGYNRYKTPRSAEPTRTDGL